MGMYFVAVLLITGLCIIHNQGVTAEHVTCRDDTNFTSADGVEPDTSLLKYEGALLLLFGYGSIAVTLAIIYVSLRYFVFRDYYKMDTALDAGGNVSTSMTAVGFAAQLLWPGDLMQSVTLCVKLGIAGAFWYCGTAIINMSLFPLLSFKFKTRAPGAKTYLQIIKARFGTHTHVVFIFFALLVNAVILATIFVGGIAMLQATISDANPEYCMVLLVALCGSYALIGGLGSTFYANYFSTVTTYIILCVFIVKVIYLDDEPFGSLEEIYNRVNCHSDVDGNHDGSRFTFLSEEAMIYAAQILFLVSSVTYCDQASWQSRIAAKPMQGALGALIGSFLWFTVPASIGLVAGVTYVAETSRNQSFALSIGQIDSGIVTAYMAEDAMATGGAIMMLTMLTLVTMSTGSAEIMAITSILVYDVYQTYIRPFRKNLPLTSCVCCGLEKTVATRSRTVSFDDMPKCQCPHVANCEDCKRDVAWLRNANRAQSHFVSHSCPYHRNLRSYQDSVINVKSWCILWVSVALVPFGVFLHAVDLDLNWTMMAGVVFTVPSFPSVILAITWAKTTSVGMIIGSIAGLLVGCGADAAVAIVKYDWDGGFVRATSAPYSVLAGSGGGFFVSLILNVIISLATHNIRSQEDADVIWHKLREIDNPLNPWSLQFAEDFPQSPDGSYRPTQRELEHLSRHAKYVSIIGSILFFILFIIVTPSVLASLEVMSFEEFEVWTMVVTIALFVATVFIAVVTPFEEIKAICKQMWKNKKNDSKKSHILGHNMNNLGRSNDNSYSSMMHEPKPFENAESAALEDQGAGPSLNTNNVDRSNVAPYRDIDEPKPFEDEASQDQGAGHSMSNVDGSKVAPYRDIDELKPFEGEASQDQGAGHSMSNVDGSKVAPYRDIDEPKPFEGEASQDQGAGHSMSNVDGSKVAPYRDIDEPKPFEGEASQDQGADNNAFQASPTDPIGLNNNF